MRIDKLRVWLERPPPGAERVQLCWETQVGSEVIADWTFDEIKTMEQCEEDLAETILAQAQEHGDAQQQKRTAYLIRWIGSESRVLRSTRHYVRPAPDGEDDPLGAVLEDVGRPDASAGGSLFYEAMVKELARALLDKDRALNEAYKTSLTANQRTIDMLLAQSETSFRQLAELRNQVAELEAQTPEHLTEAQAREADKRAQAWEKLAGILPEATEMLIHAATSRLLGPDEPAATETAPNGHAVGEA